MKGGENLKLHHGKENLRRKIKPSKNEFLFFTLSPYSIPK